jgi:K+ potassium transporter
MVDVYCLLSRCYWDVQDWRQRLISGHGVQMALRFMVVRGAYFVQACVQLHGWLHPNLTGHGIAQHTASSGRLPALPEVLGVGAVMGDGVLTPAVSVVSAVEGLKLAASGISHGTSHLRRAEQSSVAGAGCTGHWSGSFKVALGQSLAHA